MIPTPPTDAMDPTVPRLALLPRNALVDRFRVLDVLGEGGTAVVYRVQHQTLGSIHALKVVAVPSRIILRRLMGEGRAQARIRHPNIVAVHDMIEVDGCPGLILEYIDGPNLEVALLGGALDLDLADLVGRSLLRGIAAAHHAGFIHRDLKPANVLLSLSDPDQPMGGIVPKVADFGLARELSNEQRRTRSGVFMGTPHYMAPEQVRDARNVDERADLWSAGTVLYELVTGVRAFDGEHLLDLFNRIDTGQIPPIERDVPDRMRAAIDAALQVDPADRIGDANALLALWCGDVDDIQLQQRLAHSTAGDTLRALARPAPVGLEPLRGTSAAPTYPMAPAPAPLDDGPRSRFMLGAALATLIVATLGFAGITAFAAGLVLMQRSTQPTPTVVPAPSGAAPPPPEAPPPPPAAPAPIRTEPRAVTPPPAAIPEADPPPERSPARAPLPEPTPDPPAADPGTGELRVLGEVDVDLFAEDGGRHHPDVPLAPGRYVARVRFGDAEPITAGNVTIVAGQTATLACEPYLQRCNVIAE